MASSLQASDFILKVDGAEQKPCGYSHLQLPVSIGMVLDTSASMAEHKAAMRAGVEKFLSASSPQDQYFLTDVNSPKTVPVGFANDISRIRAGIAFAPRGGTALIDSLYVAAQEMQKARHPTRALIVFSDGDDNQSVYKPNHLIQALAATPVPIFLLVPITAQLPMQEVPELTRMQLPGGLPARFSDARQTEGVVTEIAAAIREPYIFYFNRPTGAAPPRSLHVALRHGAPKANLYYFAQPESASPS